MQQETMFNTTLLLVKRSVFLGWPRDFLFSSINQLQFVFETLPRNASQLSWGQHDLLDKEFEPMS